MDGMTNGYVALLVVSLVCYAEKAMLELYCERSQLKDGHTVLDVGCGWGSLSLYIARKYPSYKVTGISISITQRAFIEEQCRDKQLPNVGIIVADISTFEMEELLKKIYKCMEQDSLLFVHS